ncbi:MAG: dTMP kinase [Candidatus Babeliales bacterium]
MIVHKKGFYIAIEGIDGSGKSALIKHLAALIQSGVTTEIVVTKEPGGTELGKTLRGLVHDNKAIICDEAEFLLFAADRAQHIRSVVAPDLKQGKIVISDRSFISSIAYQGFGRGLDCGVITTINDWAINGVTPDIIFYLEIDPALALGRIEKRNEAKTSFEREQADFWARVIEGFNYCCAKYPQVIKLDASAPEEIVAQNAFEIVRTHSTSLAQGSIRSGRTDM